MRNEHLKTRLTQMTKSELLNHVEQWRKQRETYVENNPAPKRRASKKKEEKVLTMVLGLSEDERKALLQEMSDG